MADFLTKEQRSVRMATIRSVDTTPEVAVRRALHALGLRYRLHVKELPGKPDLVFPRFRTVLFVHGCFWHRHPGCKVASNPKTNTAFWLNKFQRNTQRDEEHRLQLMGRGWRVLIVWECELSSAKRTTEAARYLYAQITERAETAQHPHVGEPRKKLHK